jgi:general secretion pathway protein B
MSFILDALKKSEIERQRQNVPGLMDTRIAARRSRLPIWAIALAVLLGINLIVLLVVLTRAGKQPEVSAVPHGAAAVATGTGAGGTGAPAAADHFSPLDSAPQYAPEIPVVPTENAAPTPSSPEDTRPTRVAPLAPPISVAGTGRGFRRPDPILTEAQTRDDAREDAREDNGEVLPSISEINLSGAQTLPEMHLDVHVYATKPAERFVYINMRKYREGAILQEGPTVERIRRDGVVLSFQGLRFILPRQP